MNKYIASLLWLGSMVLTQAGPTTSDSKDMKEITPVLADKNAFDVFTGGDVRNSSYYTYAGVIWAFNGDINSTGWFLRSQVGGGQYAYGTPAIQGRVRGALFDADLGVGYKYYFDPDWSASGYVAAHDRVRSLNHADPNSDVHSVDKVGVRPGLEFTGTPGWFYANGQAQFSTVDTAVWSRLRLGYNFKDAGVIVGPEGGYLRDQDFDEYRGGAFVSYQICPMVGITISGGYSHFTAQSGSGQSNSSPYGNLGLNFAF